MCSCISHWSYVIEHVSIGGGKLVISISQRDKLYLGPNWNVEALLKSNMKARMELDFCFDKPTGNLTCFFLLRCEVLRRFYSVSQQKELRLAEICCFDNFDMIWLRYFWYFWLRFVVSIMVLQFILVRFLLEMKCFPNIKRHPKKINNRYTFCRGLFSIIYYMCTTTAFFCTIFY